MHCEMWQNNCRARWGVVERGEITIMRHLVFAKRVKETQYLVSFYKHICVTLSTPKGFIYFSYLCVLRFYCF